MHVFARRCTRDRGGPAHSPERRRPLHGTFRSTAGDHRENLRRLPGPYWRLLNRTRPEGIVRMSQLSGWSAMWW
jgi:hypothetical protein